MNDDNDEVEEGVLKEKEGFVKFDEIPDEKGAAFEVKD